MNESRPHFLTNPFFDQLFPNDDPTVATQRK